MNSSAEEDVVRVSHDWDRAMLTNDVGRIGAFMHDDWVIIGPDGGVTGKAAFLETIRSRRVSHNVMESIEIDVRVYGGTAVLYGRGISGGHFDGEPFYLRERHSNVFVRRDGQWKCVLTHLSTLDH